MTTTSTFRSVFLLSLFLSGMLLVFFAANVHAETTHWWRFEEGAFLRDSIDGVSLAAGDYRQVALPRSSDGAGAAFPKGFLGVGTNRHAFEMHPLRGATAPNTTPVAGDFTIEMFVHFDSLPNTTFTHFLGGQGTPPATPPTWSWGPQIRMDGSMGTQPGEFVTLVSEGPFYEFPRSGIILRENTDYYLASTFDLDGDMTYYVQDLTNGTDLQTVTAVHGLQRLNPDAHIVVGGSNRSCCVPEGIIDEFRFSNHVLSDDELLINNVPEPSTAILLGMVMLCWCAWSGKKSRTA